MAIYRRGGYVTSKVNNRRPPTRAVSHAPVRRDEIDAIFVLRIRVVMCRVWSCIMSIQKESTGPRSRTSSSSDSHGDAHAHAHCSDVSIDSRRGGEDVVRGTRTRAIDAARTHTVVNKMFRPELSRSSCILALGSAVSAVSSHTTISHGSA